MLLKLPFDILNYLITNFLDYKGIKLLNDTYFKSLNKIVWFENINKIYPKIFTYKKCKFKKCNNLQVVAKMNIFTIELDIEQNFFGSFVKNNDVVSYCVRIDEGFDIVYYSVINDEVIDTVYSIQNVDIEWSGLITFYDNKIFYPGTNTTGLYIFDIVNKTLHYYNNFNTVLNYYLISGDHMLVCVHENPEQEYILDLVNIHTLSVSKLVFEEHINTYVYFDPHNIFLVNMNSSDNKIIFKHSVSKKVFEHNIKTIQLKYFYKDDIKYTIHLINKNTILFLSTWVYSGILYSILLKLELIDDILNISNILTLSHGHIIYKPLSDEYFTLHVFAKIRGYSCYIYSTDNCKRIRIINMNNPVVGNVFIDNDLLLIKEQGYHIYKSIKIE